MSAAGFNRTPLERSSGDPGNYEGVVTVPTAGISNRLYSEAGDLVRFVLTSFITTLLLLSVYMASAEVPNDPLGFAYLVSIPAYYFWLLLLSTLLFLPLCTVSPAVHLAVVPKVLLDTYLILDIVVYGITGAHVSLEYFDLIVASAAVVGIPYFMITAVILSLLIVLLANLCIFDFVKRSPRWKCSPPLRLMLFIFLFGQLLHSWANETEWLSITEYTSTFPGYQPIVSSISGEPR